MSVKDLKNKRQKRNRKQRKELDRDLHYISVKKSWLNKWESTIGKGGRTPHGTDANLPINALLTLLSKIANHHC